MLTECIPDFFGFETVEGREVIAAFDAGAITSDAGALLLGATDRAIRMMDRFASCFHDVRCQELIEHEVVTLVGQRVFGIALGYEDLNDHDELRHDLSSTAKRISRSSCDRTGCRTESSNPSTTSSITAAMPGTPSSISPGKSCPSHAANGPSSVTQSEGWYKSLPQSMEFALQEQEQLSVPVVPVKCSCMV